MAFNVNHLLGDPMANVAMAYGSSIASHGKDMVHKELHRFVSVNKLKYFFAVDTAYVAKKLGLLVFPYTHQNWEVQYSRDVPLPPRQDLNAPDLYIPSESLTWAGACGQTCALRHREERGARVDSASALGAFVCGFRGVSRHRVEQVDRVG